MNYPKIESPYTCISITDDVVLLQTSDPDQSIPVRSITNIAFKKARDNDNPGYIRLTLDGQKDIKVWFDANEENEFYDLFQQLGKRMQGDNGKGTVVTSVAQSLNMQQNEFIDLVNEVMESCEYNKVDSMGKLREVTGIGISESKSIIDALYPENHIHNSPAQVQNKVVASEKNPTHSNAHFSTQFTGFGKKDRCCPKCGSANYDVVDLRETKYRSSVNLNPLHPFTFANTKEVKKDNKKLSAGKLALGVMTGGASLLVTGVSKKENFLCRCRDCGYEWYRNK